jgi:protein O-GlcNAc transferase
MKNINSAEINQWFAEINQLILEGRIDLAKSKFSEALLQPIIDAYTANLLGLVANSLNELNQAEVIYRLGIQLDPKFLPLYSNLGNLLAKKGSLIDAVNIYQEGMSCPGDQAELLVNFGLTLSYLGKNDDAVYILNKAIGLRPDFIEAHLNLGLVLTQQTRYADAAACFHRVLAINPNHSGAHNGLGLIAHQQGYVTKAEQSYERAIQVDSSDLRGKVNLANILLEGGRQSDAVKMLKKIVSADSSQRDACSNFLMCLQYDANASVAEMLDWAIKLNPPNATIFQFNRNLQKNRLLAVEKPILGFVSADFRAHPVGWFLKAIFPILKKKYQIIAYANQSASDFITEEISRHIDGWVPILGISDFQVAEKIRADRVDMLFDLSGHTSGNRLGVFSLRAAPVQISWLGYFATTGLPEMDYILMDKEHVPDGKEKYFSERVMYLDPIRLCYSPPSYAPAVQPSPNILNGYITFGSFNNSSKLNEFTIDIWAKILNQLPSSRLILKWKTYIDLGMRSRIRAMFVNRGVAPGRIQFSGVSTHDAMLAEYSEIDIALDPYPFTGATTTCEALWMGVPVVSLRGERPVSCQSAAMLNVLGLGDLIADSAQVYVDKAINLANDRARLNLLRDQLRGRLLSSSLCNPEMFTNSLINVIEQIRSSYTS